MKRTVDEKLQYNQRTEDGVFLRLPLWRSGLQAIPEGTTSGKSAIYRAI